MKTVLFILTIFVSIVEAKDQKIVLLSSHDELHKLVETGMTIGTDYRVTTYLSKSGKRLVGGKRFNFHGKEQDVEEFDRYVRFSHDFEPGSEEIKRLYDLRGKQGCFTVYMATNQLWLKSFQEGPCQ